MDIRRLELETTEALVEELQARCDAMIWVAVEDVGTDEEGGLVQWRYGGGVLRCLGMATRMQHRLMGDLEEVSSE